MVVLDVVWVHWRFAANHCKASIPSDLTLHCKFSHVHVCQEGVPILHINNNALHASSCTDATAAWCFIASTINCIAAERTQCSVVLSVSILAIIVCLCVYMHVIPLFTQMFRMTLHTAPCTRGLSLCLRLESRYRDIARGLLICNFAATADQSFGFYAWVSTVIQR